MTLTQIRRAGSTTSLGIRLTRPDDRFKAEVADAFDDRVTQPIRGSDSEENGASLDGVYLIDAAHGQKYLVARDADGRCLCDVHLSDTWVESDAPLNPSATVGAPPPEVHSIDVFVPHFGTFTDVPLS